MVPHYFRKATVWTFAEVPIERGPIEDPSQIPWYHFVMMYEGIQGALNCATMMLRATKWAKMSMLLFARRVFCPKKQQLPLPAKTSPAFPCEAFPCLAWQRALLWFFFRIQIYHLLYNQSHYLQ